MNNKAFIKKFFSGRGEIGDTSKDYIFEQEYALIFKGKVSYYKGNSHRILAWRDNEGLFHCFPLVFARPGLAEVIQGIPDDVKVQMEYIQSELATKIYLDLLTLFTLEKSSLSEEAIENLIKDINYFYTFCEGPELLWKWLNEHQKIEVHHLQDLPFDISRLPADILGKFMEIRML